MSGKYDFKGLARQLLSNAESLLAAWIPNGKREGQEWVGTNPSRSDATAGSFKVNRRTGKWSDFATGDKGGDLISLYGYLRGLSAKDSFIELSGPNFSEQLQYAKNKGNEKPLSFEEIVEPLEVPDDADPMPSPKGKKAAAEYIDPVTGEELYPVTLYKDFKGKVVYRVATTRNKAGTKKYPVPLSWCRWKREQEIWSEEKKTYEKTGKIIDTTTWNKKDWPDKRPLCGMNYVFSRAEAPVIVCEGEKVWASVIARLPEYAAVTWRGGALAVDKTDWSTLRDRDIIICPDYDRAGQTAALKIANILKRQGCNVRICWEPLLAALHPEGWDIADEKDVEKLRKFIKDTAVLLSNVEALIYQEKSEENAENDMTTEYNSLLGTISGETLNNQNDLRCLGYGADNKTYFICRRRGVVVALAPDQLGNVNHLLSLMPLSFWFDLFPNPKGGINKYDCSDALQRWADSKGYFNPDMVRGAGVWMEKDGRFVLHMGQKILVDNEVYEINEFASEYMYEATQDLGVRLTKPLGNDDASRLLELCDWLDWDCPVYGKLLAGFAAVAPMCGGLDWRPHIWVTGSAGSGKTTVISKILFRVCGKMSLYVQGDSTAAGIRQRLGSDALPVIFDEFEGENVKRMDELQKTLDLARQASSESGAMMLKGSAYGDAVEFKVRSAFAFSAINVNIQHYADASRITVLTLKDPPKDLTEEKKIERIDAYTAYEKDLEILTADYVNSLQMRTFRLLPVIKRNAKIFGNAVQKKLDSARIGDQLGILCAGAYSLEHSGVVDQKAAEDWVNAQEWTLSTPVGEDKDHDRCLSHMMQYILRIQGDHKYLEYSVGELIGIAMASPKTTLSDEADRVLRRYGIKIDYNDEGDRVIYIAAKHSKLTEIMSGTSYQSWHRLLLRCDGATQSTKTIRFSTGTVARAVCLPMKKALANAIDKAELAF